MTIGEIGLIALVLVLAGSFFWVYRQMGRRVAEEGLRAQAAYERRADRLERTIETGLRKFEEKILAIDVATKTLIDEQAKLLDQQSALFLEQKALGRTLAENEASFSALLGQQRDTLTGLEILQHAVVELEKSNSHYQIRSLAPPPDSMQQQRLDRLQNDVGFIKNRLSSYLGEGTGLTYLVDETPIYINTNDFGCPSNFINGGRYEEEYQQVLASFRRPDSVFLDIGANLGVFSLRLAPMMRRGHVYAFEPNQKIYELFTRSVHLNGLGNWIEIFQSGASDREAEMVLSVPQAHAGGASVAEVGQGLAIPGERIRVSPVDHTLSDLQRFDLAKIDVEGHELNVLRGMSALVERSPDAVILFEKLGKDTGIEAELIAFFEKFGMNLYRIDSVTLIPVDLERFRLDQAYFLAARPARMAGEFVRSFIDLYPADLYGLHAEVSGEHLVARCDVAPSTVVFHGPYWYLPRGSWRVTVVGRVDTPLQIVLAEKFGYQVAEFSASRQQMSCDFIIANDLTHFEVVGRALGGSASFEIERIRLTRLG